MKLKKMWSVGVLSWIRLWSVDNVVQKIGDVKFFCVMTSSEPPSDISCRVIHQLV